MKNTKEESNELINIETALEEVVGGIGERVTRLVNQVKANPTKAAKEALKVAEYAAGVAASVVVGYLALTGLSREVGYRIALHSAGSICKISNVLTHSMIHPVDHLSYGWSDLKDFAEWIGDIARNVKNNI